MFKQIFLWVTGSLLVLQAIQIKIPEIPKEIDSSKEIKASKEIVSLLKTSCYDCHSYKTKMPWYGHIVPMAWEVKSHIKGGRGWLNFQEWENYDEKKKQKIYKGIVKTTGFTMPMPMYLKLHKEAKLTTDQVEQIIRWAKSHIKEEE